MANAEDAALEALVARLGLGAATPRMAAALTHPSWANENPGEEHNQRLEFLGDAVLGLCVSEILMSAFAAVDEGELTVMRASLVNTRALATAARELGIAEALRLGRGAEAAGERSRTNVLADALEALIGAVYLDLGLVEARTLSHRVVERDLTSLVARGGTERDPKSRLQELLQGRGLAPPRYQITAEAGPPHDRVFTVSVEIGLGDRVVVREGSGRSKKLAEQAAAVAALDDLDQG
jgi:ribonuclease III